MKVSSWLLAPSAFVLMGLMSGCVVHDREVVPAHSASYSEGYREGYYDREHHRWWHEKAWRDCVENDEHCH